MLPVFAATLAAAIVLAPELRAQTLIDPSESVGSVPSFAGTGLSGLYYDNLDGFSSANGSLPEASFTATNVCFPDCTLNNDFQDDSGGLAAFTNGNANNITFLNGAQPRSTWNNSELDLTGFIAINQTGAYTFTTYADDNSTLIIGGQTIPSANCCSPASASVDFTATGLYAISLQFFEGGGQSGLDLIATDPSGTCVAGCYNDGALEPTGIYYSESDLEGAPAPSPGTGVLSMVVCAALLAAKRTRDLAKTHST